jgi:hypothetical protein
MCTGARHYTSRWIRNRRVVAVAELQRLALLAAHPAEVAAVQVAVEVEQVPLLVELVAVRVEARVLAVLAEVEAQAQLRLLEVHRLPLLQELQLRLAWLPLRSLRRVPLLVEVVAVVDKLADAVELAEVVVEPAAASAAVVVKLEGAVRQLVARLVRVPQFPAWRSSTRCSQRAPIRTSPSVHVVRKRVPAVVSAILC